MAEVSKLILHTPTLSELCEVIRASLAFDFEDIEVNIVNCPDLTKPPFHLVSQGLCGAPRVADVGGIPNLTPLVNRKKIYNLEKVLKDSELKDGSIMGAGAGPFHILGGNSEMISNLHGAQNNTKIAKLDLGQEKGYILKETGTTDFGLLGNFFISHGKPGMVIEVKIGRRKGEKDIIRCLRTGLEKEYGEKPVALGGAFCVETGKCKIHIMPDFSEAPLETDEDLNNWLKFYEMNSPLTCLGYLVSHDPGFDLRMEHFHCFSEHGDGGHFHNDTTPNDVSYRGYFNVAELLYRIDRPNKNLMVGGF